MRPAALALLLVLAAACASKSPDEQLLDTVAPAASRAASLRMTGEKWLANSVPKNFALNSIDAATKDFNKVAKAIDESNASPSLRSRLREDVVRSTYAARALRRAIGRNDREAVPAIARTLSQMSGDFAAAKKSVEGSS